MHKRRTNYKLQCYLSTNTEGSKIYSFFLTSAYSGLLNCVPVAKNAAIIKLTNLGEEKNEILRLHKNIKTFMKRMKFGPIYP